MRWIRRSTDGLDDLTPSPWSRIAQATGDERTPLEDIRAEMERIPRVPVITGTMYLSDAGRAALERAALERAVSLEESAAAAAAISNTHGVPPYITGDVQPPRGELEINVETTRMITSIWPCPAENHTERGCYAEVARITQDAIEERQGALALGFISSHQGQIRYDCGSRRLVPPSLLYAEFMRGQWDPNITWSETRDEGVDGFDDTMTIHGVSYCIHQAEVLTLNVTFTATSADASDGHVRERVRDVIRRSFVTSRCGCLEPGRALTEHAVAVYRERLASMSEMLAARLQERLEGLVAEEPEAGSWLENPEVLDGPVTLVIESDPTMDVDSSLIYDGASGATIEDLHLVEHVDAAIKRIDQVLEEVGDDAEN